MIPNSTMHKLTEITGLYVTEFGYLLRGVMKRRGIEIDLCNDEDLREIQKLSDDILKALDEEIVADNMIEYAIHRDTAIHNLKNLKKVINEICKLKLEEETKC